MSILEDIDRFSIDFKNIVITIKNIETKHKQIVENLAYLKIQYSDMVKNNTKKIFIFCLDSFFYQYKMYSAELDQIESSRKMVNNRMYCEYYKLFGIISNYLNDSNVTYENKRTLLKTCPIYKDLEPMFEFDMVDIENIYSNVILLITHLYEQTIKNSVEIEDFSETRNGDYKRTMYNGKCQIIVQGGKSAGNIEIEATGEGLQTVWCGINKNKESFI